MTTQKTTTKQTHGERKEGRKERKKEEKKNEERERKKGWVLKRIILGSRNALVMHQLIPAVPIPPASGISGAFFLIVRPGGQALVYPEAFDGVVIFTSQPCHLLSVISSSGKDDKYVINFV